MLTGCRRFAIAGLMLASSSLLLSQSLTIGVIGGTNLTDDVESGRQESFPSSGAMVSEPGARRPIIGVKLEYKLPRNWAIEFNALHREWKSTTRLIFGTPIELPDGTLITVFGPTKRTLTTWEFPLLAKYRFTAGRLHPFVTVGPSFRPAGTGTNLSHAGITAGGGLAFEAAGFRIEPALRYTRWMAARGNPPFGPLKNQVELLVGFDRPSTSPGIRAFGRRLSFGLLAGIAPGDDFQVDRAFFGETSEANSAFFGVLIEMGLWKDLSMEVDGIYRPLHGWASEFDRRVRFAHLTWEFPVLLKYCFLPGARWRPFVESGPSFRAEGNVNLARVSHYGAIVGAGLETKVGPLRIAPTARYTRWGQSDSGGLRTWANQTHLLVSLTY